MTEFVLASGNKKKIAELTEILNAFGYQLRPQGEWGVEDAIEDGLSFVENAIIKARHAAKATGLPAIADDSGLEVDALNGRPGIYSARYASGDGHAAAGDSANNQKLLEELEGVPAEKRTARYRCVIVLMRHADDPMPMICQGTWEGSILTQPQGDGGFGYDPLFWLANEQCSVAQLPAERKRALSHRGQALQQLHQQLQHLSVD